MCLKTGYKSYDEKVKKLLAVAKVENALFTHRGFICDGIGLDEVSPLFTFSLSRPLLTPTCYENVLLKGALNDSVFFLTLPFRLIDHLTQNIAKWMFYTRRR